MAQAKNDKNSKPQDSFADDLDSMLELDGATGQDVGLIDDDDAIDRLLMGDAFEAELPEENAASQFNDIDRLIDSEVNQDGKVVPDFDEFGDDFDDLIADIQINPKQTKEAEPEPLNALNTDGGAGLGGVEAIETFPDEEPALAEIMVEADAGNDVLEKMTEIDEFSEEPVQNQSGNADFLLADFDISVDDEFGEDDDRPESAGERLSEPEPVIPEDVPVVEPENDPVTEELIPAEEAEVIDSGAETEEAAVIAENGALDVSDDEPQPAPKDSKPEVDYAALIAGLSKQIGDLVKQQAHVKHEVQLKSGKDELTALADTIDTLQNEQKKAKRNIETLTNKKPVSAYVANGMAVAALLVGGGLGYQGYVAKSQVAQLIEYVGKMQTQINEAPTADAAEKEMLRKQLDELSRANSVVSEQIAELTKSMQGQAGAGKPAGELGKQLADLNNQDMQMGAAIEALQSKVAALEKSKATTVPAAKPVAKKPPVVEDNWVVNLVAFKQDWYAQRKAEEFAGKGVPAKVAKTESKGETWYRLSVDGFKSEYEAAAYAARVKKTLNLDSVWVNKNKK
ncbi:SPOR domain-containing protein [Methylomonas rivi]|uniref:SPOR domain-containing protein n=1 Tax=Methylomonas rivi TaxID=2952226 RepID=A0ABT1U6Z9_9GAMM|nr:SPOR domain-containing protein [Methylomonas sp. WSC-6]MCQ8129613.1 SPOR domain-containing protein [Methylomonas sp. WSC-6]